MPTGGGSPPPRIEAGNSGHPPGPATAAILPHQHTWYVRPPRTSGLSILSTGASHTEASQDPARSIVWWCPDHPGVSALLRRICVGGAEQFRRVTHKARHRHYGSNRRPGTQRRLFGQVHGRVHGQIFWQVL